MTLAFPISPALRGLADLQSDPAALPRSKMRRGSSPILPGLPAGAARRIYPFETRRGGEARTVPPRTVGIAGLVQASSPLPGSTDAARAIAVASNVPSSPEAAKEKVGFARLDGATAIYQADRQTVSASLCACGNATGAAAALLAHYLGRPEVRQNLQLPEGQVEVHSKVSRSCTGASQVVQSWEGIELAVTEIELFGRRAAVCRGDLNDYLIVRLPDVDELNAFDVADALDLWDAVRGPLGFADRLRSRLAVFASANPRPQVKFYTCGRMHPGAPLTGLATLAIAAERVSWMAPLLRAGEIEHRRGTDLLPRVGHSPAGAIITLPTIDVVLHGL